MLCLSSLLSVFFASLCFLCKDNSNEFKQLAVFFKQKQLGGSSKKKTKKLWKKHDVWEGKPTTVTHWGVLNRGSALPAEIFAPMTFNARNKARIDLVWQFSELVGLFGLVWL